MKKPLVRVTDHAVLRYLERVQGWGVERLRTEIGRRVDWAARAGASGVVIEGCRYMLRHDSEGASVITVIPVQHNFGDKGAGQSELDDGRLSDAGQPE